MWMWLHVSLSFRLMIIFLLSYMGSVSVHAYGCSIASLSGAVFVGFGIKCGSNLSCLAVCFDVFCEGGICV